MYSILCAHGAGTQVVTYANQPHYGVSTMETQRQTEARRVSRNILCVVGHVVGGGVDVDTMA